MAGGIPSTTKLGKMKLVSLFTVILLASALCLSAQVTLTRGDFPRAAGFIDSSRLVADPGVPFPREGADLLWDYASLGTGTPYNPSFYDATADTSFTDALNYEHDDMQFSLPAFGYLVGGDLYEALDSNGWYRTGRNIESATIPLTPLTGGPNDRIEYPATQADYIGRLDLLKFPMNYQDEWNEGYYFDIPFQVTLAAYGLNQASAFNRITVSNNRRVVGYGKLVMPTDDGSPSVPMDVLLTKVVTTQIDSIFLGGNPAPEALPAALGLSRGFVQQDSFYLFYTPGFGAPVMLFEFPRNGLVGQVRYRPQAADLSTAVREPKAPLIAGYPNPVAAGSWFHLRLERPLDAGCIHFFSPKGQLLATRTYEGGAGTNIQVKVPANIDTGLLFYRVTDKSNLPLGTGKLLVY